MITALGQRHKNLHKMLKKKQKKKKTDFPKCFLYGLSHNIESQYEEPIDEKKFYIRKVLLKCKKKNNEC